MTMLSLIRGYSSVFQHIGDAYSKKDEQRFYYGYELCIRAKTNIKLLHKYLYNRHNFNRKDCASLLMLARRIMRSRFRSERKNIPPV